MSDLKKSLAKVSVQVRDEQFYRKRIPHCRQAKAFLLKSTQ
jgi:hypothetical protein